MQSMSYRTQYPNIEKQTLLDAPKPEETKKIEESQIQEKPAVLVRVISKYKKFK